MNQGDESPVEVPFAGFVTPLVSLGDEVTVDQPLALIEAMKMEAVLSAPQAGVVASVAITEPTAMQGGDILLTIA